MIGLSAPDALIMDLFGPFAGRHHDMRMVTESDINRHIRDLQLGNKNQYCMYADKGYADMSHLIAAYHGANLTQPQIQINCILTLVRVSVEWYFGNISEIKCTLISRVASNCSCNQLENTID